MRCAVINTNVFACPEGEENTSDVATRKAIANASGDGVPIGVPHPDVDDDAAGKFMDRLPRSMVVELGGVKIGLLGLCTTSTPLSSAKKPKGVVFAECVPLARAAARALRNEVDAIIALTHQTLPEDARLAEDVPEIAAILGGHEHTPFAGRMGHGANGFSAQIAANVDANGISTPHTTQCVNAEAGTLCVKAGMDAENVIVVTIDVPFVSVRGTDRGGECDATAAAQALATVAATDANASAVFDAARKHHDEFGRGGLWKYKEEDAFTETSDKEESNDEPECGFVTDATRACVTASLNNVIPTLRESEVSEASDADKYSSEIENNDDSFPKAPGAELGGEVAVVRPGSNVRVAARMFSLRGYRTCPEIDADIWHRSEVLRGLNAHTLSLHEHAVKLGFTSLSSKDSRSGQCTLGTMFATYVQGLSQIPTRCLLDPSTPDCLPIVRP